jgi:tRNA threonylcarbamoyladenosine biosynthesis protein TsaE
VDTIISNSAEETVHAGENLSRRLRGGEVVALCGDLGAGKTHFTKGIVAGLGGDPREVSSPTFTLVHEYRDGRLPVYHFDFYRLEEASELRGVGWEDYLREDGVLIVEWADRFAAELPRDAIRVRFLIGEGDARILEVS